MIGRDADLSVARQCGIVGVSRSRFYSKPGDSVRAKDLALMRLIDKIYTDWPFYGSRRIAAHLRRHGHDVNRKRIQRLMRLMGIYGQSPGIMTSVPRRGRQKYPYLLGDIAIDRPDKAWCADITYIPLEHGSAYLVAIIDWYSRAVLAWELSNTLDGDFCVRALSRAIGRYGVPDIFNTDQGCQFTSEGFTGMLKSHGISISMDGKGRCSDNIIVERFWRSLKYECVYMNEYKDMSGLREGLEAYIEFYNGGRLHESLGYRPPMEVYAGRAAA